MAKSNNYDATAHKAQMAILRALLLSESHSFSELVKSSGLSSDHANFHIKTLIENQLIKRIPKTHGIYTLTRKGKEYANRMDTDDNSIEKQPKLSVVLVVENDRGEFLQQERLKQPYYGYWGFPTGKIRWGETMIEAGTRELLEETGLTADLVTLGFYHKLDYDENGNLLEDKYLCLIHGTDPTGELLAESDGQRNAWMTVEKLESMEKKFGSIAETVQVVRSKKMVLLEKTYAYHSDHY